LLSAFPQLLIAMKLLGGGYLLFLGTKALRVARRGSKHGEGAAGVTRTGRQAYATGLLVVLTNPKAALMWAAVARFLASASVYPCPCLLVGVWLSLSAMAIYGANALLFSTSVATRAHARVFRVVEATFGAMFGVLGTKLMADGIKELRA
jgi:threonine/homoserine/homoserine lactone efflux protein